MLNTNMYLCDCICVCDSQKTQEHSSLFLFLFLFLMIDFFIKAFFIRYFLHLHFKCYPQIPLFHSPASLPNPPISASWPWHSPVLGHMIFAIPRTSPHIDGQLGHFLLHMRLEIQLWELLVSSYHCSSYTVTDPIAPLVLSLDLH